MLYLCPLDANFFLKLLQCNNDLIQCFYHQIIPFVTVMNNWNVTSANYVDLIGGHGWLDSLHLHLSGRTIVAIQDIVETSAVHFQLVAPLPEHLQPRVDHLLEHVTHGARGGHHALRHAVHVQGDVCAGLLLVHGQQERAQDGALGQRVHRVVLRARPSLLHCLHHHALGAPVQHEHELLLRAGEVDGEERLDAAT